MRLGFVWPGVGGPNFDFGKDPARCSGEISTCHQQAGHLRPITGELIDKLAQARSVHRADVRGPWEFPPAGPSILQACQRRHIPGCRGVQEWSNNSSVEVFTYPRSFVRGKLPGTIAGFSALVYIATRPSLSCAITTLLYRLSMVSTGLGASVHHFSAS